MEWRIHGAAEWALGTTTSFLPYISGQIGEAISLILRPQIQRKLMGTESEKPCNASGLAAVLACRVVAIPFPRAHIVNLAGASWQNRISRAGIECFELKLYLTPLSRVQRRASWNWASQKTMAVCYLMERTEIICSSDDIQFLRGQSYHRDTCTPLLLAPSSQYHLREVREIAGCFFRPVVPRSVVSILSALSEVSFGD